MRKLWLIVKREYVTRVRSKGFVISTVALPLLSIGLFIFSIFVALHQVDHTLRLAILDGAGGLAPAIERGLDRKLSNGRPAFRVVESLERPESEEKVRGRLRSKVRSGQLDGYIVVPPGVAAGKPAEFHTKNPGNFTVTEEIDRSVSNAIIGLRLNERGARVENVADVVRDVDLKLLRITKRGETEEKGQTFVVAVSMTMILYLTLIMYGVITMRSVLEEKTTRTMEVLISAATPFQLMAGKILGVAAVGLTQYLVWALSALLITAYGTAMAAIPRSGIRASIPQIYIPAPLLFFFVIFFLLGYFLYASFFASIGAAASNEHDAQQMQWPATLPLIFSFVMFSFILRDPNSTTAVVLSLVPFFTPILMLLRISAEPPPFWQIGLSMVLTLLTTLGVIYLSARIYRVGVLMYGKRPSVVELLRWLRYS
jgi:ABC-2 type transport system permease protein